MIEETIKGVAVSGLFIGDWVSGALFQDGHYEFFASDDRHNAIIGRAGRRIHIGQIIDYNPSRDTDDIIVSNGRYMPCIVKENNNVVLSREGTDDNPDNHPPRTSRTWAIQTRAALIENQKSIRAQIKALQEQIRAVGRQIAALEKEYKIGDE